jgi:hypothetical protein
MASGLPLVVPNSGGVISYANLENAWTVPATVEHFAAAVSEITSNPARAFEKTQKALASAKAYGWEEIASSFLDLYESLFAMFHGQATRLQADFHSTPAQFGTARIAHWAAQLAQKMFAVIASLHQAKVAMVKKRNSRASDIRTEDAL